MIAIFVLASLASAVQGVDIVDIAQYQELTLEISESVAPTQCNHTLTMIEVRQFSLICFFSFSMGSITFN